MLCLITPALRNRYKKELSRFFLSRYLCDRNPAPSYSPLQRLTDDFDTAATVYLTYNDPHYAFCAGLRLTPQSDCRIVCNCSGFFINLPRASPKFNARYSEIAQWLLKGLKGYANSHDIMRIFTLLPAETHQRLLECGWPLERLKTTTELEAAPFIEGVLEVGSIII